MKKAKLAASLGALAIGGALLTGAPAVADEGDRHLRAAPHHEFVDGGETPYRPAPHHPDPGNATVPHELLADPPTAASSGGRFGWDKAVTGGAAIAVLVLTAGALARRRQAPRRAQHGEGLEAVDARR